MTTDLIDVRAAKNADCEALAGIHSEAWLGAYRGVLHGVDLDRMVAKRGADWWRSALAKGVEIQILSVAGTPGGYATFGSCRLSDVQATGEIYELYLKPEYQGLGFGKMLFENVRSKLNASGRAGLAIQVLSDNQSARAFYSAMGGKLVKKSWYRLGMKRLELSVFQWAATS